MLQKTTLLIFILLLSASYGKAQNSTIPEIKNGQLWVDGSPHLMIAGEVHNSSASTVEYMEGVWPKLKSLNINTVLATVKWEQFEPKEGEYDYEMIDHLISRSEKEGIKLVVVWFGSWKNGQSSYVPMWVKKDTKRFPRVKTEDGQLVETLSVFSDESRNADKKAFTALMKRIKKKDKNNTVIMVQPENEVGIFQDIDYRKEALSAYNDDVPQGLIDYMEENTDILKDELKSVWDAAGSKTSGSWIDVFGDNPQSKEFFMAWHYAEYINEIAESGRAIHNLPMYVNAWIVQQPGDLPGVYPNGGPVSRVLDIYKAAAPAIDVVSPDIYLPNYKEIYEMYYREQDNPLLVPESTLDAARAFYAFAEYDAICYSPFGIESGAGDVLFAESYRVLRELEPVITKYQRTGKMRGIHLSKDFQDDVKYIDGFEINLKIQDPNKPAFGLVIKTGETEFLVSGLNFKATFTKSSGDYIHYIGKVSEGRYEGDNWIVTRWLNGDETFHNLLLRALGRPIEINEGFVNKEADLDVNEGEQFTYTPGGTQTIDTPGIYKVTLYKRPGK